MYTPLSTRCPYCFGRMNTQRLQCGHCHISVEGNFVMSKLARLGATEQEFIEKFILASGSLKDLAEEMGISYPTVRNRLDQIIELLKQPEDENKERRQHVLDAVDKGKITADEASRLLKK